MKTLDQYIKKLPVTERAAIEAGAQRKIAVLRLQQAREAAGLTQEQVAEHMGVTQATLSRLEHRPDVKLSNIRRAISKPSVVAWKSAWCCPADVRREPVPVG